MAATDNEPRAKSLRGSKNPNAVPCRLCRRMVDRDLMAGHLRQYCRVNQAIQRGVVYAEAPRPTPTGQHAPFDRALAETVLFMAAEQAIDGRTLSIKDAVHIGNAIDQLVDVLQEVSS